jgi:hypothetical protein
LLHPEPLKQTLKQYKMSKKITPQQNQANMQNANKGTSGQNQQHAQTQGNRGKQLDPQQGGKSSNQSGKKK